MAPICTLLMRPNSTPPAFPWPPDGCKLSLTCSHPRPFPWGNSATPDAWSLSPASILTVQLNNECILDGVRAPHTGLWHLNLAPSSCAHIAALPPTPPPVCSHHSFAAVQSATPAELVAFAHAALFSPALSSTLDTALARGFLPHFMELTTKTLRRHPPTSVAMVKGHLDQTRKNQHSAKQVAAPPTDLVTDSDPTAPQSADAFPPSDPGNVRLHHSCYAAVIEPVTGQIHSNQTSKFVNASSTGNNYILVVYDYDSNGILVEPLRSRTGPCILAAFQLVHARLVAAGLPPNFIAWTTSTLRH